MSIIDWIKEYSSHEAKLKRLALKVEREEKKAKYAEKEKELLERKRIASHIVAEKDSIKHAIRTEKAAKLKGMLPKPKPSSGFKLKTPSDRVFKT